MTEKAQVPVVTSPEVEVLAGDDSPDSKSMLMTALRNNADPAVLSKLMDLQERWQAQKAKREYVEAMTKFKAEVPAVLTKDKRVSFETKTGRTSYTHATLGRVVAKITPSLSTHGLSVSWETEQAQGGGVRVTCHITHSGGHRESVTLIGPPDSSGSKNSIQQIGSTVTYLQRYTMLAALGLATADQDSDGNPTTTEPPIQQPRAVEDPPKTAQPTAEPPPAQGGIAVGVVDAIRLKTGNRPWGAKIGGEWYTSFSDTHGQVIASAKGKSVRVEYVMKGDYRNISDIAYATEAAPEPDPNSDGGGANGAQDKLPI